MTSEPLPSTVIDELNGVRDAFEAAWSAGQRPPIEAYLSARTEPERTVLFQMLLDVEVKARRRAGEGPTSREYIAKFEEYTTVIRTVFGEPKSGDQTEPATPPKTEEGPGASPQVHLTTTVLAPPGQGDRQAGPTSWVFPDRIGLYELIRPLGRGNFEVYLGRDDRDGRYVAIKFARRDDPSGRHRLMSLAREAEKLEGARPPSNRQDV